MLKHSPLSARYSPLTAHGSRLTLKTYFVQLLFGDQLILITLEVYLNTGIVVTAPRPLIIIPLDNVDKCRPHDSLISSDLEAALTEGRCMHTLVL